MAQITAPLSIMNGAASPVAKSFAPERVAPEGSVFTERTSPVSAGYTRLTVAYSAASVKRPTNRVDMALDLPVVALVNGVNTVTHTLRFKGYFVIPDVATAAERADLRAFVANALDNTHMIGVVKDLDPMY